MSAALLALLDDKDAYIACEAAYAVSYLGETEKGVKRLNYPQNEADRKIGYSLVGVPVFGKGDATCGTGTFGRFERES